MELEYRLDLEYTKMPYLVKVSIKIEVAFGFHNCQFQVSARNAFCAVMVIGPQTSAYFCYNSLGQRTLAVEDMNRNGHAVSGGPSGGGGFWRRKAVFWRVIANRRLLAAGFMVKYRR